ncbi:MAG: transposase [Chloroflexota bacterium]|nr:transposase [Chloroflexota bacterium]
MPTTPFILLPTICVQYNPMSDIRSYAHDHRRGQAVVKRILGGTCTGHLVRDFSCGSHADAGKHPRCWVHLLRDLHARTEAPADARWWSGGRRPCGRAMRGCTSRLRQARRRARCGTLSWERGRMGGAWRTRGRRSMRVRRWPSGGCGMQTSGFSLCWWQDGARTTIWRSAACDHWW